MILSFFVPQQIMSVEREGRQRCEYVGAIAMGVFIIPFGERTNVRKVEMKNSGFRTGGAAFPR